MIAMLKQPNYLGLVALLPTLHRLVDAGGKVILEPNEVEQIRALGFHADAGPWRVPRLPANLVAGNPLLEPLGDDVDSFWTPSSEASAETLQARQPAETPPDVLDVMSPGARASSSTTASPRSSEAKTTCALEKECAAILAAVERAGGSIPKRLLQKKLWRVRADRFNQVIQSLVERGEIYVEGNMLMAQLVPQPALPQFHMVPQSGRNVPQVASAPGLTSTPDQLTDFGVPLKEIGNAN